MQFASAILINTESTKQLEKYYLFRGPLFFFEESSLSPRALGAKKNKQKKKTFSELDLMSEEMGGRIVQCHLLHPA